MKNLNHFGRNDFKPILVCTVFIFIGWVQQSEGQAGGEIKTVKEDPQLTRRVNLSFSVSQLEGDVCIAVYSKKSSAQILGVKKGNADGEITELKLSDDAGWEYHWTSDVKRATKSQTQFDNKFTTEFKFVEPRPMKFVVMDSNSQKVLGTHLTYLSDIATNAQVVEQLKKEISKGKWQDTEGVIVIDCKEDLTGYNDQVAYEFVGKNFVDASRSLLPYMVVLKRMKKNGEETWIDVDRTFMNGSDNPKNPEFRPLSVRVSHITEEKNKELQLRFKCFLRNYERPNQKPVYLGQFDTTYLELTADTDFVCIKPEEEDTGKNIVKLKARVTVPTFLEIIPGLEIRAIISIDFTQSNQQGSWRRHRMGMHHVTQQSFNYYEQAILSIIPIVEHYDDDKEMPVMGFGGRIPGSDEANHCFPLRPLMGPDADGQKRDENCLGTLGVLETYRYLMLKEKIILSAPTHYQPSFEYVRELACKSKGDNNAFYLYVVLTDGDYTDEMKTKAEIAMASECPLSIILVGIGNASFEKLEELDNDDGLPLKGVDKKGHKHEAVADIVQLVKYKDFIGTLDTPIAMKRLKDAVLEEFPVHVQNYFKLHQLRPNQRTRRNKPKTSEPKSIVAKNRKDLAQMLNYEGA